MIFLLVLLVLTPIAIFQMETGFGGIVSRIVGLILILFSACAAIYCGVMLPEVRSVFLQIAAAELALIVIIIAYNIYMNRRGRW